MYLVYTTFPSSYIPQSLFFRSYRSMLCMLLLQLWAKISTIRTFVAFSCLRYSVSSIGGKLLSDAKQGTPTNTTCKSFGLTRRQVHTNIHIANIAVIYTNCITNERARTISLMPLNKYPCTVCAHHFLCASSGLTATRTAVLTIQLYPIPAFLT